MHEALQREGRDRFTALNLLYQAIKRFYLSSNSSTCKAMWNDLQYSIKWLKNAVSFQKNNLFGAEIIKIIKRMLLIFLMIVIEF